MRSLIQFSLVAFLVISGFAVWKFGKWLKIKLNPAESFAGLFLYFIIHFILIILIVIAFKYLMIFLVEHYVTTQ